MPQDPTPVCAHHPGDVRMRLQSLHSDSIRPESLAGLFTCPECGAERRVPMTQEELALAEAEVA